MMENLRCSTCNAIAGAWERGSGMCNLCGGEMPVDQDALRGRSERVTDHPWIPSQIGLVTILFGVVAGAVIMGINFVRMGKRQFLIPSILIGLVLFFVQFCLLVLVSKSGLDGLLTVLGIAGISLAFMVMVRPHFEAWKNENWRPKKMGERYKPNMMAELFLVSLLCMGVQLGLLYLLHLAVGKWNV